MPSYNSKLKDEITFYSDHIEYLIDGEWTLLPSDLVSGTAELRCTRLAKDGSSITCDVYDHEVWKSLQAFPDGLTLEIISSNIWTETS